MNRWKIKFKTSEGMDYWEMLYPIEPDEETIITDIVENQGEYTNCEISVLSIIKM